MLIALLIQFYIKVVKLQQFHLLPSGLVRPKFTLKWVQSKDEQFALTRHTEMMHNNCSKKWKTTGNEWAWECVTCISHQALSRQHNITKSMKWKIRPPAEETAEGKVYSFFQLLSCWFGKCADYQHQQRRKHCLQFSLLNLFFGKSCTHVCDTLGINYGLTWCLAISLFVCRIFVLKFSFCISLIQRNEEKSFHFEFFMKREKLFHCFKKLLKKFISVKTEGKLHKTAHKHHHKFFLFYGWIFIQLRRQERQQENEEIFLLKKEVFPLN